MKFLIIMNLSLFPLIAESRTLIDCPSGPFKDGISLIEEDDELVVTYKSWETNPDMFRELTKGDASGKNLELRFPTPACRINSSFITDCRSNGKAGTWKIDDWVYARSFDGVLGTTISRTSLKEKTTYWGGKVVVLRSIYWEFRYDMNKAPAKLEIDLRKCTVK